ncbi:MAG TPA: Asp-tRNA(Asn)/Glu-tRNA(Gln) amidotransferase subunit GatC [Casimicrobiaceae bacterium]|nr:Asp-tRNA(Asn)/Glu-tRNA(Gln) amidotransferase subunit GatC [Casimicrobiaceae bacterium]
MPLSPDEVRRLADLARIGLSEVELQSVRANLDSIFGLIDALQAIPTQGIEPLAHAHDMKAPLRDDVVTASDRHSLYQSVAPAVEDGLYLVPKVIE